MKNLIFNLLNIDWTKYPLTLGDSVYPLLKWLMKPFPHNGALTQEQKRFNYHLSTARVVSENAFGRLNGGVFPSALT